MFAWRKLPSNLRRLLPLLIIVIAVSSGTVFSRSGLHYWAFHEGSKADLTTAHNLLTSSIFSRQNPRGKNTVKPDRAQPPGYPAVLAAIAAMDAKVATGLACYGLRGGECQLGYPFLSVSIVQTAAGVGILILIYYLTLELTGSWLIGYATVVIFVVLARLGEFARHLRPDNFQNLAIFAGLLLMALAVRRRSVVNALLAGLCFGIAALFHPPFAYFSLTAPFILILITFLTVRDTETRRFLSRAGGAFMLGAIITMGPWALRNLTLFGDPLLTDLYEARNLAIRLAYNGMSINEWFASFLHWIPSYGNDISRLAFDISTTAKLDGANPGTYYASGQAILDKAIVATPPGGHPIKQLINDHIANAPLWHLVTTVPMFARGMWGSHGFFAIVGILLLPVLIRKMRPTPQFDAALAVVVTCLALVLINALVTPNFFWLNLQMAFLAALAIACRLERPLRRLAERVSPSQKNLPGDLAVARNSTDRASPKYRSAGDD